MLAIDLDWDETELALMYDGKPMAIGLVDTVIEITWDASGDWHISDIAIVNRTPAVDYTGSRTWKVLNLSRGMTGNDDRMWKGTKALLYADERFVAYVQDNIPGDLAAGLYAEDSAEEAFEMSRRI